MLLSTSPVRVSSATTAAVLGVALSLTAFPRISTAQGPTPQGPTSSADPAETSSRSIGAAFGRLGDRLDDWVDHFDFYGFLSTRFMDTAAGGSHPDGFFGVHQALVFIEADVKDVATAVLEVEFDYFRDNDQNGTGVNEAYIRIDNFTGDADPDDGFTFVAGRFNLPFGEYYSFEDPPGNFMIGLPILMPYRWDEGIMVYGSGAPGGFVVALTEGTYDRASSTGLSPALTARLHTEPTENLYISVSGHFANETPASALCLGGSVITPVGGGSAGASPSSTVDALLGVVNVQWQATSSLWIHASAGVAQVDDRVDSFDREFGWWTLEPSWEIDETWRATLRWSGVSTFDAGEGYQFEGRPYGNGVATYGFDLTRAQRLAACVTCTFAPGLIGKIEAGFDDFVATNQSALPDDTREFFAAELVLSF